MSSNAILQRIGAFRRCVLAGAPRSSSPAAADSRATRRLRKTLGRQPAALGAQRA